MARSHAKIKCSIWRDPDWLALSANAKLLYLTVLSQQRLSLVGTLDMARSRWAALLPLPGDDLENALTELDAARFLVVDWSTEEVLVRTFTHHDIDPNRVNVNLARGLWGQWAQIDSPALRSVALHEMPAAAWEKLEPHAPGDAVQTRRSARLEPEGRPRLEPEERPRIEPPPYSLLPPVTNHPPGDTLPVQADLEHPPTPKLGPSAISEYRSELDALKQAVPHLVKGPAA